MASRRKHRRRRRRYLDDFTPVDYLAGMANIRDDPQYIRLADATKELLAENDALRAQLAEQTAQLAEQTAKAETNEKALLHLLEERGTLGVLQEMARDPRLPPNIRVKAAEIAVSYERPKVAVMAHTEFSLYRHLEDRRAPRKLPPPTIDGKPAA
jgi:hypothetical protein